MKLTTKALIAAALLAGVAGTSNAAEAGWYIGAGVGAAQTTIDIQRDTNYKEDKNATNYKVFGGYQFNKNWALELQYADLGTYKRTNGGSSFELKTNVVSLSGVGMLPLADHFSLLGKIGVAAQNGKTTSRGIYTGTDGTNTALLLGAGAEYNFTKSVAVRAEYERIGSSNLKNNLLTVGLRYSF